MSPHSAQFQPAIHALLLLTTWHGHHWVDLERHRDGETKHTWTRVETARDRQRIVRLVQDLDERYSPEILMPLPRPKRAWGTVHGSTVLWARVEGTEQVQRAARFRPMPTLVLREGGSSRRLLIWALTQQLGWEDTVRANKRIAYRLGAKQKDGDPDLLRIPMPGTCLREGRSRPVPVVVTRLEEDAMFKASEVVKRLKDPPPPPEWLGRRAA